MATRTIPSRSQRLLLPLGLLALSLALTLLGILARPIESLSLFWPVNAILLGLLLRQPRLASPAGWLAIYAGMVGGDLLSASDWASALWLNACNLGLIVVARQLLLPLSRAQLRLRQPGAILLLFLACAAGAAVAASMASVMSVQFFDNTTLTTWLAWFSEQFSTCVLLLPVLLSVPPPRHWHRPRQLPRRPMPLVALGLALSAALLIGGPGALALPLPALLWCALRYRLFVIALLSLLTGGAAIVMVAANLAHFGPLQSGAGVDALMSARLGIAMLVLGPLLMACVTAANQRLLKRLEHRANHDYLTGALARSALTQQTSDLLERRRQHPEGTPLALLMIDIDHFKAINDQHGHHTGDRVLRRFAQQLQQQLRHGELFGRLGGEEFVVVLPGVSAAEALHVAERLRLLIERLEFPLSLGGSLRITISIGIACLDAGSEHPPLEQVLSRADGALYRAKAQGRNRVMAADTERA
ncbi:GGDEF domain-containing protein [Pseudomonas sp. UL073]|uniref:diguanylate cyclase n=1 Tax=Zestomonas insulae TaxID=2809017 RepID=A0ABS2IHV9_9GAMM|nr:GGDEF domain-containing protein [Pseudomonas insulae]MBM7062650.1 GGDEF domain-containing protein [Pseudomonas insulae]